MSAGLLLLVVLVTAVSVGLRLLNLGHLARQSGVVPPEFAGSLDPATLDKAAAYTRERTRFGIARSVFVTVAIAACLFSGLFERYDRAVAGTAPSLVLGGVVFFLGLGLALALLELPFTAYSSFVVEARHGFNHTPARLFASDLAKSLLLGGVLLAGLSAGGLTLVRLAPAWYWLWVWLLLLVVSVLLTLIAPYVIEPLFFKLTPLEAPELAPRIRALCERAGVRVSRVLSMDASRRSAHSNAYFTGIGPVKRVVLFDTLLSRVSADEILAVLAHELGHWKRRHVTERFVLSQLFTLVACYVAYRLIGWGGLPACIGAQALSFPARVVVAGYLGSLVQFALTPLASFWSRRHEWQADDFARELTERPEDLASALVKLARDNLSNLFPHPWFSAFYASHPPTLARVRKLRGTS